MNVTAVKEQVLRAVQDVEALRGADVVDGSSLRGDRLDLSSAATDTQDHMRRFFFFLQSLPAGKRFDIYAFFPRGQMGVLSELKLPDLLAWTDDADAWDTMRAQPRFTQPATANPLLDDREVQARRVWRYGVSASLVAVACLVAPCGCTSHRTTPGHQLASTRSRSRPIPSSRPPSSGI